MASPRTGCFFRHSDPKGLKQHLTDRAGLSLGVANEIVQLAENQHYQLACRSYFNARHPGQVCTCVCLSPVCVCVGVLCDTVNPPNVLKEYGVALS